MKASTLIGLAIGAVVLLIVGLAIAKAVTPRPRSTLETLIHEAPAFLAIFG